jgi:ubiquinone/menaquinone biosynthesis C-methylase UbiE
MTNAPFVDFLRVAQGMRVLEVGSGLGVLAGDVASAAARVEVVGLERSPEQLAAAATIRSVACVRGDAVALPFADATFDLVYSRYLLEHVADPERAVAEMRRVVGTGGRVAACENDISLIRLDPPCPAFEALWEAFGRYQASLGGDALIGRRLYRLFRRAGFDAIELSVQPEVHWYGRASFAPWIANLIGNIEGARSGLIGARFADATSIEAAVAELTALRATPEASSHFMWNRVMAW